MQDFCKQVDLEEIVYGIHLKGATLCLYGLSARTPVEYYLGNLKGLIKYICRYKEDI